MTEPAAASRPHRVAAVVLDGATLFETAIAFELFGQDRRHLTADWYEFRLVAGRRGRVRTEAGLAVDTPYGLEALEWADTILVLPCDDSTGPPALHRALRGAYARGARLASICTGAFILAAAGLLDGRRATTHWAHAPALAAAYPSIHVDPDVLYVEDERIFTSAGAASGIDLCLHLIRRDLGSDVANTIARRLVVPPHRDGGQAQFVDVPLPACDVDTISPLLDWVLAHLDEPLTVEDLARRVSMSPRTLMRRFQSATGTTPLQWLLMQRVRRAQHLLESTDEPIERVATLAGFGTAANLRQHFSRTVGVAPVTYRRTFRLQTAG